MRSLSKSMIIAYRQCPKRLWLEIHRPDLRDDSASEMVFAIGNQPAGHIRYDGILRVTYPHLVKRSLSLKQEVLRS